MNAASRVLTYRRSFGGAWLPTSDSSAIDDILGVAHLTRHGLAAFVNARCTAAAGTALLLAGAIGGPTSAAGTTSRVPGT